jgi:hypothetical protein
MEAKDKKIIVKTAPGNLVLKFEPCIYVEQVNLKKKRGWEFGAQMHTGGGIAGGLIHLRDENRSLGGPYYLANPPPHYRISRIGFSMFLQYKFYTNHLKIFLGPQVGFMYKEGKNILFTSEEIHGPSAIAPFYYYYSDHYTKCVNTFFNIGSNYDLSKQRGVMEYGALLGVKFSDDKCIVHSWGWGHMNNGTYNPNFVTDVQSGNVTKGLNGFSVKPILRFYFRLGLSW